MVTKMLWVLLLAVIVVNGDFDPFADFNNPFYNTIDFSSLFNHLEEELKPMRISEAKNKLTHGIGGITIVNARGRIIIIKEGTSYVCKGLVTPQFPYCHGILAKFQTKTPRDYCFSESYHQSGDVLCIAHSSHTGLSFSNNNGHYSCIGSNKNPVLMITMQQYFNLCSRLPWEKTMYYFPDSQSPFHVHLPNPDLGCLENSNDDMCIFKPTPTL